MFKNDYFTEEELACRCCGKNHFSDDTLQRLIRVRERFKKPMVINSGYRCPAHCAFTGSMKSADRVKAALVDLCAELERIQPELVDFDIEFGEIYARPKTL
ncbi:D-Ala-D-Ala carboxypeptidase family metallohydrolase [Microbulbifer sp. 2201CG32-9]|uniref:D-Ala-D-Ala carboxypeptidase family metallohydrolase n=1 Tax=Microbulbifer sp. 2201CG32-9 TaxID=3232309 RepID=UPI00345C3C8E